MKQFFLLVIACAPVCLHAQFTSGTRITHADSTSYLTTNNATAFIAQGQTLHLVFTDRRDGTDEVYYKRSLDGGLSWEAERRLTEDDNIFSGNPTIGAWNNEVHIAWMDRRDGNNELYYARSTNNGNTWSDPVRLTENVANSEFPSLAVDFQSLHLVWSDTRTSPGEIYYKRSTNGGLSWSQDIQLSFTPGGSFKPTVATIDSLVHVAWVDLRDNNSEIIYLRSSDNGFTWSDTVMLSDLGTDCFAPCLSANGEIVMATWDDNRTVNSEIYGRRSTDGGLTWTPEANLSKSAAESYNAYHTFAGTYMCMTYSEKQNSNEDIYTLFSSDAGAAWTRLSPLATTAAASRNAFVAIDGPIVHTIWQDNMFGNDELLYARNPNANLFDDDHSLSFAQHLHSSQKDIANAMIADASGNIYVTGSFSGAVDFEPGTGSTMLTSSGSTDAFIYKLTEDGRLAWARQLGGAGTDNGYDVVVDADGNVIVAGSFHSIVDFDPGVNVFPIGSFGQEDMFIIKLNPAGELMWVKRIGGTGRDEPQRIVLHPSGDIIVSGYFSEFADFDPGPNTTLMQSFGEEDVFVARYTSAGNFVWSKSVGGTGDDMALALTIDTVSQLTLTGSFENTVDFDPGQGTRQITSAGAGDIFLWRLQDNGNYLWAYGLGSTDEDAGLAITTDPAGNIYATGTFRNTVNFSTNGLYPIAAGEAADMFILSLFSNGQFRWAQGYGGGGLANGIDAGTAIRELDGYLYVAGAFENKVDFQPGPKVIELFASGERDIVLQKIRSQNAELQWVQQLGGPERDVVQSLIVVPHGKIGIAGYFNGEADFSPTIEQMHFVSAGEEDGFVALVYECQPQQVLLQATACGEYVFDETHTYQVSGEYTIVLKSEAGCDSLVTLDLTILQPAHTALSASGCDSYTTPDGNFTWTQSGTYTDTLVALNGCDSVVIYHVTIHRSFASSITTSACDMYIDPVGNAITQSGDYIYEFVTKAGCDSTITLHLTIYPSATTEINVEACDSYTTPDGSHTWPVSGTYLVHAETNHGCDSLVTIHLQITNWNTAVTIHENTLTAINQFANYQWVDCNDNYAPIAGANIWTFTPESSGSYAVIISSGECYDTSACYAVTIVSTESADDSDLIIVTPNPTTGLVQVKLPNATDEVQLALYDVTGRRINTAFNFIQDMITLTIDSPTGIYFLQAKTRFGLRVIKITKH